MRMTIVMQKANSDVRLLFFGMIIQFDSKYMFSHVRDSTYIAVLYKPIANVIGRVFHAIVSKFYAFNIRDTIR